MDAHLLLKHIITAASLSRSPKHIVTMAPTRRQRRVALAGVRGSVGVVVASDVARQGATSSSRDTYPGRLFLTPRLSRPSSPLRRHFFDLYPFLSLIGGTARETLAGRERERE